MHPVPQAPEPWKKIGESPLATTRIFDLHYARYRHPQRGIERDFAVITAPDWVNVVALTPDGRLVLVNQFRFGTAVMSLEIPGGMIDQGEDPVAAGVRELREETGYVGAGARLLGSVHPNPAIFGNRCHLVLVEDAVQTAPMEWDHDEDIVVSTAPVGDVLAWARGGRITHALVLNALFMFEPIWKKRAGA
jgi:ADP-ribose pyrophosphatase